jgi:hypothetical protein
MDPDFLLSLLESMSLMRLSLKKAAYADLSRAAYRKFGGILGVQSNQHENFLHSANLDSTDLKVTLVQIC